MERIENRTDKERSVHKTNACAAREIVCFAFTTERGKRNITERNGTERNGTETYAQRFGGGAELPLPLLLGRLHLRSQPIFLCQPLGHHFTVLCVVLRHVSE